MNVPIEIDHNATGVMIAVDGTEMPLVEGYFSSTKCKKRPDTNQGIGALLVHLLEQRSIGRDLAAQQAHLGVSLFDQAAKASNQACALCSKGCESLVLISEISAGSGVTRKLGVTGRAGADVVLQACNADSISSAASL